MYPRHTTRHLSSEERLERAASVANIAMLRTYSEPSSFSIKTIEWLTFLLESDLRTLPTDGTPVRTKILAQLDINRSILAPIRRLPAELLSEIFSRVVKKTPLRTLQAAATLSSVCITWRKVARGHAALWARVIVKTPCDFDRYNELFLPLTKDISLDLRCEDRRILSDMWDRIAPYASRWRSITLEGQLSMLPDLKVLHLERLERLVVDAYDAPISAELSALDFVVAPDLRHIGFTMDVLQSERQLHIPVTRALTSVEITAMSPFPVTRVLSLLQGCAETLQDLTLRTRYPLEGSEGSYPTTAAKTFVMKALTRLVLIDPACALLNHISAPVIDELVLGNVPEYGTRSLMGFLTRDQTSRHLESLRVYRVEERDVSAWASCLQLMVKLRNLYFDELLSNPEFLEILFLRDDRPALLPSLENIAIVEIFHGNPDLQGLIARMCATRAKFTYVRGRERLETIGWIDENVY